MKKLKEINPFEPGKKPFPYPKAITCYYKGMPSWLKTKEKRYRGGVGRIQNMNPDEYE